MAEVADDAARDRAIRRYGQLEERFAALGGYGAESEAGRICASLGLPDRVLTQQLRTLSGGQRRRVELARILFAASDTGAGSATTLLLDEPTNHLDADSVGWLRDFLRSHTGGLVVISHNVDLLADVVNRVWFLDAVRGEADVYNMGWQKYLDARATDEQRRRRERSNAERKATALRTQAAKLGAKATKAVAAQNMLRRADRMMAALDEERVADKVARIKFPTPLVMRAHTTDRLRADEDLRLAGDLHRGGSGHRPRFAGGGTRTQRRGEDNAAAVAGRRRAARCRGDRARTWVENRVFRAGARHPRRRRDRMGEHPPRRSRLRRARAARSARARSCSAAANSTNRPARCPAVRRPGWRSPAWWLPRPTCCCSTSRPTTSIPASREQVLDALRSYAGAVVLVTHDPGAAEALDPQRVVLLPDGTEDHWSDEYRDLIELA